MLSSLSVTAFALEKPSADSDGASIFVNDVRVEKKSEANPVEVPFKVSAGSDYTAMRSGTLVFDINPDSTGISNTSPLTGAVVNAGDVSMAIPAKTLKNTGKGKFNIAGGQKQEIDFKLTLPNVTATTKINVSVENLFGQNDANPTGVRIDASKIKIVSGSVIVQYPVTVEIAADSERPANFAIKTKTTEHTTGKHT